MQYAKPLSSLRLRDLALPVGRCLLPPGASSSETEVRAEHQSLFMKQIVSEGTAAAACFPPAQGFLATNSDTE